MTLWRPWCNDNTAVCGTVITGLIPVGRPKPLTEYTSGLLFLDTKKRRALRPTGPLISDDPR